MTFWGNINPHACVQKMPASASYARGKICAPPSYACIQRCTRRPLLPASQRCARLGSYRAATESSLPPFFQPRSPPRSGATWREISAIKEPLLHRWSPPFGPGNSFLRPIPFHLLPLHYAPFSLPLQFVRRFLGFHFSTLSGFEFSAIAEFSREGRTSRVAPSGSPCMPFRTSVHSLRSSSIDSQFERTVGLDYSLIKLH